MTDIVDRLRLFVPHCEDPNDYLEDELLFLKAAEEIERLRKAIDDIEFWVADSIAKSRAALEEKE